MAKLFSDGDFADSAPAAVLSESDFADSGEPGQVLSESDFADSPGQDKGSDLRKRLKQKDSLLNKIGYVKNRTKEDKPDAEGLTLDDYRNFVTSSDFNTLDEERLNLVAQAVDAKHADVSKKRGIFRIAADSVARGIPKAIYRTAEGRMAAQADSQENRDTIQSHIAAEAETDVNHPRAVAGVKDIRGVGDALKLAVEVTGENVGNAVAPLAAGYAGAKAGLVAGGPVGAIIGAKVGSGIGSLSGNLGEAVRDHYNDTGEAGTSVGVVAQGIGYSVIDAVLGGEATAIKHMFKGVSGEALKAAKKNFVGSIGKAVLEVAKGGAKGGLGEALQSQVVGRSRRLAETGSALENGESGTDALWAAADEFYGGFFGDAASSSIGVGAEYSRNKAMLKRADVVISKLSADKDVDSIKGFDKKLVSDYMLGMAAMPEVDAGKQDIIRAKQAEIMDAADGQTKAVLNAYQSMFTDASFDNIPDTVKPTFNAQKAYESKIEEQDGSETYFDADSGIMIQGREGAWSVFNRNGMKMPLTEENNVKTIKDAIVFAQNLTRLNQWRIENNQAKSEFIQKLAEKNHPGANVVMVDSPLQIKDEGIRSRFIGNEHGFYNPGDNTVYMMLDAVQNPAQAAIVLNHEDFHSGFDATLKATGKSRDELLGKTGLGDNVTAEEYLAEAYAQREKDPATYSKAKLAVQKWIGEKTGIRSLVGDAEMKLLIQKVSAQNKERGNGTVEYQQEGQSDANQIRYEDAKNGRLTLEEEAQRQNDAAPDEKVSQERVINRDTRRAGLVAGMNQPVEPSVVVDTQTPVGEQQEPLLSTSETQEKPSTVRSFVKTELRTDRIKEKHADLFQQALDVTDNDEQAAAGLVSEWLAGQNIADKSIPDSVRVASKLEQKADLTAKDADTLEQNAVFGKDLFMFGYRKDKETGAWKFQQPVQEAPQSTPIEPVTSEPVVAEKPAEPKPSAGDKMRRESFRSFFDAANQSGEYDLLQRWYEGNGLFGKPSKTAGGEYDAYRALPPNLKKMIRGKSKLEITSASKELAEEFGPEYADPVIGPELLVNEFVRQYGAYQGWKENGAVPDVQADEYAQRAKAEHRQEQEDLATYKQKVDNGEVIADGSFIAVRTGADTVRMAGVDPEWPIVRVERSRVVNGILVYDAVSPSGSVFTVNADEIEADLGKETEVDDEAERNSFESSYELSELAARKVREDRERDYERDEREAIEGEPPLRNTGESQGTVQEDEVGKGKGKLAPRGKNDGSLFDEGDLDFNLDGGTQDDVVRIAAEKKAEEDRQKEAKRKLDAAPVLPMDGNPVVATVLSKKGDKVSTSPERVQETPKTEQLRKTEQFKRGTKIATTRNADGVSYFGEVLQSNPDGTVKIRAFKEKTKGTIGAKGYGVDSKGNQVTKDVDVPAESVKSVDATADTSKLTDEERRKLKMAEAVDADNADNELRKGSAVAAPDIVDKFNDAKERKEQRKTDNGNVMFRHAIADKGYFEASNALVTKPGEVRFRRAYHGSPHLFNRFDISKIGTGEGAQAYGWGLYFADEKEVAKVYQKLGKKELRFNGNPIGSLTGTQEVVLDAIEQFNGDWEAAKSWFQSETRFGYKGGDAKRVRILDEFKEIGPKVTVIDHSALYEVDIDVEDNELLDLDAPLSKQSDKVRAALGPLLEAWVGNDYDTSRIGGQQIYNRAAIIDGGSENASSYLNSIGIKGIKYADQMSRTGDYKASRIWENEKHPERPQWQVSSNRGVMETFMTEDEAKEEARRLTEESRTYNYVIFDDKLIKITKRNDQEAKGYDEDGGVRFRRSYVTPEQDAEYLDSVERGDMETAQKMVDEAAKAAGYTIKAYHNTDAEKITTFWPFARDLLNKEKSLSDVQQFLEEHRKRVANNERIGYMLFRAGTFFTPHIDQYEGYGKFKYSTYLKVKNPVTLTNDGKPATGIGPNKSIDALIIKNNGTIDEIAVIDPTQIKSADAVTRDDQGNVIPLSQRFNEESNDIRFRRPVDQTQTPEFKRWFGDSKVVDSDGKPLVVYHGTSNTLGQYGVFMRGQGGYIYTTPNPDYAEVFSGNNGAMYPLFASSDNPLDLREFGPSSVSQKTFIEYLIDKGVDVSEVDIEGSYAGRVFRFVKLDGFKEAAKKAGYDSIRFIEDARGRTGEAILLFGPEQVKSAIANNGEFDPSNPDIMFRRAMSGTPSGADILDTETGLQAARRIVQDYMQPWERKQESLQKTLKRKLSDDVDVYRAEDRSYGLIRNGVHQFEKNFIDKAEKVLNENGLTVDEFDQFLMAKAGPDRNKMIADRTEGKNLTGSGQSDVYWNNILAAYRKQGKYDKLNEAAEHVWALNRAVLDMKVEAGLMSKAQADVWKTKSPFYVPLRSDDAEADYKELGKRASFSLKRKESKSATGRAEGHEADTPFAFSVMQSLEAVGRANKNVVYDTAAKLIEQNPSDLWHIEKRIPTKHAYDSESGKVISVPDAQFEDSPNVVIVKRDGKKQYLVFEGADGLKLARSLKKDSLQKAPAMVSALTRTYAMMRTAMVPTFILRNLRADFLQLTINMTAENKARMVPEVFKSMKDSWQAVWSYERDGKASGALAGYANEFFSNGGQIAGVGVQTVDKINQTLNKHVKKHGAMMQKVMKAEHFYEYIERGNATIETGTRLALYATLRKQGYSISDSIEAGKNITVNFNRKGELGPLVNSLYMFSNVAVQDAARSVKALSGKNGKAVVLGLLGAGFLAAMLNNGDDDKEDKTGAGNYKNIPESDKQRNIIIKVGGKYVKQPIRGIWAWVYYAGTKAGDVAFGKYDSAKAAKNVAGAAFDTINFLGTSGSVAQFVTPTILDPVVQHLENKDWKGAPMRQRKFTDAQPDSATGMKRTPEWIKATAKGLNRLTGGDDATKGLIDVAPETIKHVIDTMAGGLGTDASYAVGAVSDAAKGNFDVDKTPFVRDVVRDLPDSTREYYVAKDKFEAGVYAVNHYKTAKERSAYYRKNPFMKPSLADRIKNLNKTIKEIRESESKTDNADRKKLLEARRLRLQSTVLRLMSEGASK